MYKQALWLAPAPPIFDANIQFINHKKLKASRKEYMSLLLMKRNHAYSASIRRNLDSSCVYGLIRETFTTDKADTKGTVKPRI